MNKDVCLTGLTQDEFARRINVSRETNRNWEQEKRCPTGVARAVLCVLDKAPENALRILTQCVNVGHGMDRDFGEAVVVDVMINC